MKTTIEKYWIDEGIDLWYEVAHALNEEILKQGKLQKNNKLIWGTILHKWNNLDYAKVLGVMRELMDKHPEMFSGNNDSAVLAAEIILRNNWNRPTGKEKMWGPDARCLDQPEFKYDAWKLIMAMREVWNKCCDINIVNDDASKLPLGPNKPCLFQ
jgi:hypothetical protein